ncbi:MAG TPA: Holliday junction branch migration protein RuvA [Candidatus Paceibacterota bacterium]|nr:Holliday junction branch migration protein RuvA [Candidatus Paceibacterota bacterium]
MIGKLRGTFAGTTHDGMCIIEVGGVGYAVRVPIAFLANMRGQSGEVSLYIHTAVKEDAIDLYGFSDGDDLIFFRQLTSVTGIGPKSALNVLNLADAKTLKRSIASGDTSMLTKVFGIGKKSAERIVVELRDKLLEESTSRGETVGGGEDGEVIEALMALGYSAGESRKAVKEIPPATKSLQERLSAALKYLGSNNK